MFEENLEAFQVVSWLRPGRSIGMGGAIYSRPEVAEMREATTALGFEWGAEMFAKVAGAFDAVVTQMNKRAAQQ